MPGETSTDVLSREPRTVGEESRRRRPGEGRPEKVGRRSKARAVGNRVASARGGDEYDVEIAARNARLKAGAQAIAQYVVAGASVRGVDGGDVYASSSKASCEVKIVSLP